jgi:2-C-methyl-D-erythritol 4-phosphate cytidylyltransferase
MRDVGVVIVAAGAGHRFGGDVPKQFRDLLGVPLLLRALRPFAQHPDVVHVTIVLAPEDAAAPPEWLRPHVGDRLSLVAGGTERSDSVSAGLAALPPACELVLVHDGARPFPERDVIDRIIALARAGTAAVAAVPVRDTLKRAIPGTDPPLVAGTVPRENLWRAQTPQGFPRSVLTEAHRRALEHGQLATDDAALAEAIGVPVALVPDTPRNLKVTVPEDLLLAEALVTKAGGA